MKEILKKSLSDLEISVVKKDMKYFMLPKINGELLLMEHISASEYKDFQLGKLSQEELFLKHNPEYFEENIKNGKRLLNYILCIRFFSGMHSIVSASQFPYTNLSQGCH